MPAMPIPKRLRSLSRRLANRWTKPLNPTGTNTMQQNPIYDIWRILSLPRSQVESEIRALCQQAYLGDYEALCRILGRYKMYVDTRDIGISSHLMLEGYWEMWVTAAMMKAVRRGSVVADVGANLGYFTLLLADLTGAEGRVLSFEPNPNIAGRLRKSIEVNGFGAFTDLHEMALGGEEGLVSMDIRLDQPGGGRTITAGSAGGGAPGETRIRMGRFDEIPHALDTEFMKIDVEGFEPHVWAGMSGLLARKKPLTIFMEFTIGRFPDAQGFLEEILSHGFGLEIIDFNEGVVPISREELFGGPHDVDHMLVFRRG